MRQQVVIETGLGFLENVGIDLDLSSGLHGSR